ncbi:hypothetical protein [Actinosynnema sp. ALI-1.44]|uniref:hypothetical protein n=1 Tax=Actinosynnema sp. ALI-1.44 TaxID=1933779 RepID=UPI00117789E1|nr:hypothetical protein [Actinosynnema sp. ALI-1.44]
METTGIVLWGTNPERGVYYAARLHVVSRQCPWTALCGLPVEQVWEQRPITSHRLCPECCLLAIAWMFPAADQQLPVLDLADRTQPTTPQSTTDSKRDIMPITEYPALALKEPV